MATDADNARVWGDGAVFKGAYGATAPTSTSGAPASHDDLGFVSEDGIELTLPDGADTEVLRAWQGRAVVRVIRNPSDEVASYTLTFLEEKKEVVETYFGVEVDDATGSFEYSNNPDREPNSYVFDYIDGASLKRDHVPRGVVASVGSYTVNATGLSGYQVTIDAEDDTTAGYAIKSWSTALVVTP